MFVLDSRPYDFTRTHPRSRWPCVCQHGFRGATTRLIAIEAGVNEVTLFRTFGSKSALFESLMDTHVAGAPIPSSPTIRSNPEREMTEWVTLFSTHMRENRPRSFAHRSAKSKNGPRPPSFLCEAAALCRDDSPTMSCALQSKASLLQMETSRSPSAMLMGSCYERRDARAIHA